MRTITLGLDRIHVVLHDLSAFGFYVLLRVCVALLGKVHVHSIPIFTMNIQFRCTSK